LIKKPINKIKLIAQKCNKSAIKDFINENDIELFRVHDTLCGEYANVIIGENFIKLFVRTEHDILFGSLGIKKPQTHFQYIVTKIFNEFMKGITYFRHDQDIGNPIYHRPDSCGDGKLNWSDKFEIKPSDSDKTKETKKRITKWCFLERSIYNTLFMHIYNYQDGGHLNEFRNVTNAYQDQNPGCGIVIDIEYSKNDMYPEKIDIFYKSPYKIPEVETYIKKWNNKFIHCTRMYGALVLEKVQTFEKEEPWMIPLGPR